MIPLTSFVFISYRFLIRFEGCCHLFLLLCLRLYYFLKLLLLIVLGQLLEVVRLSKSLTVLLAERGERLELLLGQLLCSCYLILIVFSTSRIPLCRPRGAREIAAALESSARLLVKQGNLFVRIYRCNAFSTVIAQ